MSKLILLLSLLGTALLFSFGLTDPNSPVMWLASTSMNFALLRVIIMLTLAALLVTHPPRNVYLRLLIGAFTVSLAGWTLYGTYANHIKIVDTLSLLQFSVSAGLVVLESDFKSAPAEEDRLATLRASRRHSTAAA